MRVRQWVLASDPAVYSGLFRLLADGAAFRWFENSRVTYFYVEYFSAFLQATPGCQTGRIPSIRPASC